MYTFLLQELKKATTKNTKKKRPPPPRENWIPRPSAERRWTHCGFCATKLLSPSTLLLETSCHSWVVMGVSSHSSSSGSSSSMSSARHRHTAETSRNTSSHGKTRMVWGTAVGGWGRPRGLRSRPPPLCPVAFGGWLDGNRFGASECVKNGLPQVPPATCHLKCWARTRILVWCGHSGRLWLGLSSNWGPICLWFAKSTATDQTSNLSQGRSFKVTVGKESALPKAEVPIAHS